MVAAMTDERLCLLDPRHHYQRAHVCDHCRTWLAELLTDIATLYAQIPDALTHGTGSGGQRVSGSFEAPLPLRVDILDLTLPANQGARRLCARGYLGLDDDQVGTLSASTILDTWARDWLTYDIPGHLPRPTVPILVAWLRVRVEDACNVHPGIDEFAGEMRDLRDALRRATGGATIRPQRCDGVPCRRCDLLTLVRLADGSGDIECANPECRAIMRAGEYLTWCRLVSASIKEAAA
jgi:hypothetical protein